MRGPRQGRGPFLFAAFPDWRDSMLSNRHANPYALHASCDVLAALLIQTTGALPMSVGLWVDAGGLVVAAEGVAKGFEWIEGALSPEGKAVVSRWLTNLPPDAGSGNWPGAFSDIVDRVFTKEPASIKFFLRSCVASIIAFVVVVLTYARIHPESFEDMAHVWFALCLFAIASLVPDYLSLMISRSIVRRMAQHPNTTSVLALLAADTIFKTLLATCVIYVGSLIVMGILQGSHAWALAWETVRSFYADFPPFRSKSGPLTGILFYSSFFTSAWVWLYVLGGFLTKALIKTGRLWRLLTPFLDLNANPLKSIGRVIGAATFFIGALFVASVHISR